MLTVLPPAVLLIIGLIYLPYAAYNIWRIHSAQSIIRRNHALPTTTWAFQQKEYEENQKQFAHYSTLFFVFLWIATCCVLELCLGHHTRFMPLDYCILFVGSLGAAGLYLGLRPDSELSADDKGMHGVWATVILGFCSVFALQWEIATIVAVCGGVKMLLFPSGSPEA